MTLIEHEESGLPNHILLPASKADIPTLACVAVQAFAPDLMFRIFFPSQDFSYTSHVETLTRQLSDRTYMVIKAVDAQSGEIMGFASLHLFATGLSSSTFPLSLPLPSASSSPSRTGVENLPMTMGDGEASEGEPQREFPARSGLPEHVLERFRTAIERYFHGREYHALGTLVTAPRFQRRGVGTALLKHGHARADRDGVACWLMSTPFAWRLYRSVEWRVVETMALDLREWALVDGREEEAEAGWGVYRCRWMVRENVGKRDGRISGEEIFSCS